MQYLVRQLDSYPFLKMRGLRTGRTILTLTFGLFTVDFEREESPLTGWLLYFGFGCLTYCRRRWEA
ncbi:MAG TPA: hypothetical protein VGB17_16275 [Pyrinomonadaceae bacterium]|jgi:hypothetical protein